MKKPIVRMMSLLLLFLLTPFYPEASAADDLKDVTVILRDGTLITATGTSSGFHPDTSGFPACDKFMKLKSLNISEIILSTGTETYKLDWSHTVDLIYSIELLSPELRYYKEGKMRVTKRTGEVLEMAKGTLLQYIGHDYPTSDLNVYLYDGLNKDWKEAFVDIRDVKQIVLHSDEVKPFSPQGMALPEKDLVFETDAEGIQNRLLAHGGSGSGDGSGQSAKLKIEFAFDSSTIRPSSYPLLQELGKAITSDVLNEREIVIHGHTDSDGSEAYNDKLSMRRANAVRSYLIKHFKIASSRLSILAFGETRPLVPNTTPDNKQINRRVEITAPL